MTYWAQVFPNDDGSDDPWRLTVSIGDDQEAVWFSDSGSFEACQMSAHCVATTLRGLGHVAHVLEVVD